MSTTSIFSFDHGQKKINNAIGVKEEFLEDLQTQIADTLRNYMFDADRNIKEDLSPSFLIEKALHNFSYNQLVVMSGMFLISKMEEFTETIAEKLQDAVKIASEDLPDDIREILTRIADEGGKIDGDSLPPNVKDFLDKLARRRKGDGDDD